MATANTTKNHELLAVEKSLQTAALKMIEDLGAKFVKGTLYKGTSRTLTFFDKPTERELEINALEAKEKRNEVPADTVVGSLNYGLDIIGSYYRLLFRKESSNRRAVADVEIDGNVLIAEAPAYWLLKMESKLSELRVVIDKIPTLDNAVPWQQADGLPAGIVKSPITTTTKTERKLLTYVIPGTLTDKHPAQTKEQTQDVNVGKYEDYKLSGEMSTINKSEILTRIDKLINAFRVARQKANNVDAAEVVTVDRQIFSYIFGHDYQPGSQA